MSNSDQFGSGEGDDRTSDPFGWGGIVYGFIFAAVVGVIVIAILGF